MLWYRLEVYVVVIFALRQYISQSPYLIYFCLYVSDFASGLVAFVHFYSITFFVGLLLQMLVEECRLLSALRRETPMWLNGGSG